MILGHGHPAVVEAVQKAVLEGFSYGAPTEREIELVEADNKVRRTSKYRGQDIDQLQGGGGTDFDPAITYASSRQMLDGVIYLTELIALEHGAGGIRANCVCPGNIETPMLLQSIAREPNPEQVMQKANQASVLGRLGKPEEVAQAILFLASDDSAYITGSTLVVDGGRLLKLS